MLIGISGKMQSGKDTVALICQYLYDYHRNQYTHPITERDFNEYVKNNHHLKCNWKKKSFADKLKNCVCIILGCTREQLEDPVFKETVLGEDWWYWKSKAGSSKFIPYGKELIRTNHFDLIKLTPRRLMQLLGTEAGREIIHPDIWVNSTMVDYEFEESKWLIPDVRFPNEAKAIKNKEGILIRVNRNKTLNKVNNISKHESETALDYYEEWDYIIDNEGSIEELIEKVKEVLIKEKIIYDNKN